MRYSRVANIFRISRIVSAFLTTGLDITLKPFLDINFIVRECTSYENGDFAPARAMRFTPMLHKLERVNAFGGLSEAGESSLGQHLCDHDDSKWARRSRHCAFITNSKISPTAITGSES